MLVPFHTCVQYGEGMARVEGGRMEGCKRWKGGNGDCWWPHESANRAVGNVRA